MKNWLKPTSLVIAVSESLSTYTRTVNEGRLSYPAHRRKNTNVVEVWRDLRLESLSSLYLFGKSEAIILATASRQNEVFSSFLVEKPYLRLPQPHGEQLIDTIQAVWQVYVYLQKVGSEVADRETDNATLKLSKRSILDGLIARAELLHFEWKSFEKMITSSSGTLAPPPPTFFELVFDDVTKKSKSIAMSALFGPSYEANFLNMQRRISDTGGDTTQARLLYDRLRAAKDPDEFSQR